MVQGWRVMMRVVCVVCLAVCSCRVETVALNGRVVDMARLPLAGARVQVSVEREVSQAANPKIHSTMREVVGAAIADANGCFKFERVPRMPVTIKASFPYHQGFTGTFNPEQFANIEILLDSGSAE